MLAIPDACADLLFREARTAERFTDEPVTDRLLEEIWDLVKWAPTSASQSPGRLLLVRSPQARERLVAHMSEGNRAKTLAAPLTVVTAADTRFHERWALLAPERSEAAARLEGDPDARLRLATMGATLQTAYLILGIRAAGLAAGPMGGFSREGVDGEFFADGAWRSLLVINIGHPEPGEQRPRIPRIAFADVSRVV